MGIARLYHADARQAIEQGTLMPVLPRLQLAPTPVTLLTPSRDQVPAKTRVAIAALKMHLAKLGGVSGA